MPAFTGMACTSKIHWSDGSESGLVASPPSGTVVVPPELTADRVPSETPGADASKPTVRVTEAPAARLAGSVPPPETWNAPA